ncbi:MAG TPA: GNAT family protein [Gemmatimonadales bacterium]|nr:GNAT family protein [Gemmatimonadales bacterium]
MELPVGPDLHLASLRRDDAPALLAILDGERSAFDPWLRWSSELREVDAAERFIADAIEREATGNGFHLGIRRAGRLVGGVVCWYIQPYHRSCELGYWLAPAERGEGVVTRSMRVVIGRMFTVEGVHRIELQCAVHNEASRRVAERLGFELEGVRRGSHWITDRFVDHAVYGLLVEDPR